MSAQERIDRGDNLFALLNRLRGEDFGGHPECAETDPELFFPLPENLHQIKFAKAICARCPVQDACREQAVRTGQHGIWGGTTEIERAHLRRNRGLAASEHGETFEEAA